MSRRAGAHMTIAYHASQRYTVGTGFVLSRASTVSRSVLCEQTHPVRSCRLSVMHDCVVMRALCLYLDCCRLSDSTNSSNAISQRRYTTTKSMLSQRSPGPGLNNPDYGPGTQTSHSSPTDRRSNLKLKCKVVLASLAALLHWDRIRGRDLTAVEWFEDSEQGNRIKSNNNIIVSS